MMDTEKEQEIEEAGGEVERLSRENETLILQLRSREDEIGRIVNEATELKKSIKELETSLKESEEARRELDASLSEAVAAYRNMVVEANPGVLAELVTGETIEEVDTSLKKARALVEKVRQEVEAEAARTRVPAGAPQRTPPDLSGLSPGEKIRYAIGGVS